MPGGRGGESATRLALPSEPRASMETPRAGTVLRDVADELGRRVLQAGDPADLFHRAISGSGITEFVVNLGCAG